MTDTIKLAYKRGVAWQQAGGMRVPVMDVEFMRTLQNGNNVVGHLDAWIKGWDDANWDEVKED